MTTVFDLSYQALRCCGADEKIAKIQALSNWLNDSQFTTNSDLTVQKIQTPGRPSIPLHVNPTELRPRKLGSVAGRVALIHAVAHIEFNAMNLALDAMYRFRGMPLEYYRDWISVAVDEASHFTMLVHRLSELDTYYGALPAHGGLWAMAVETDYDVLVRMALVPRVLEARGLDVTPMMLDKLNHVGDLKTVKILERILREEVEHVRIGNRWYNYLCGLRGLPADKTFRELLYKHARAALRGPFNIPARLEAGFSEAELSELDEIEKLFKEEAAL